MEKEINYTIAEEYSLPSKGLIYEKEFSPYVKLRSMTTMEEMKRTAPTNLPYKTLTEIIDSCLVTKLPTSTYDLCIGDYEYLLHKLRVVTYSPDYKMAVVCPNCGKVINANINLDELQVNEFDVAEFKDLLTMTLPTNGNIITLNVMTPRMLDEISVRTKELEKKSSNATLDFGLLAELEKVIGTVDESTLSFTEKQSFIQKLPLKDLNKIKQRINLINKKVGLKTDNIQVGCPACGYEVNTFFRIGPEFFRPTED